LPVPAPEYLQNSLPLLKSIRDELYLNLTSCSLCPNRCQINRTDGKLGCCKAPNHLLIGSFAVHNGEEPPLSGTRGSGTVFYSHCTLSCIYCQNYPLSQLHHGKKYSTEELAQIFLDLQEKGCHNINWVSPTQFLPFILDALLMAREQGLKIPIVYNSSGWESEWIVEHLRYFVDVFLPDSRYSSDQTAYAYSKAGSYVDRNKKVLTLMHQFQPKALFEDDVMVKGMIVRVLILPGHHEESIQVLRNLKEMLGTDVHISLMSQYFPCYLALDHSPLDRKISSLEYDEVVMEMEKLGFNLGWAQDLE
jgi:putative pyruvate formate lyase activating enzyme